MNEEIDAYLNTIKTLIEIWEESTPRSLEIAKALNLNLTLLKVMIGSERFDGLDAFNRYLKVTTKYINFKEGNDKDEK